MTIAILGNGAIAGFVADALAARDVPICATLVRKGKEGPGRVSDVVDLPKGTKLLVDCAGHSGLAEHGAAALRRGIPVLTLSIGALADDRFRADMRAAAEAGDVSLMLASGAIGALDALRAAKAGGLERVTYTGRKPPRGWLGSPAEEVVDLASKLDHPVTHFEGTAREAALAYPKNANVAAAVALAGIGFDETRVALIADPNVDANIHEIEAVGAFGELTFTIAGNSLPTSPRSSALAAMSMVAAILEPEKAIRF